MPFLSPLPRRYADVRARLGELPDGPGVYQFHDRAGRLLYVGKAACLKARVRSYFGSQAGRNPKLRRLRSRVNGVEWIETDSELEALLLESRLVKKRHPPFNTLLQRHRHLVFLRLDLTDPFPRLEVTEDLCRDGARYFGPLILTADAERLADILSDTLGLRTCDPPGERLHQFPPCLRRDLGLCLAPCSSAASTSAYLDAVQSAMLAFEQDGRACRDRLRAEMTDSAERLLFERAARLRDALQSLESLTGRQQAVLSAVDSLDLVVVCPSRPPSNLILFLFQSGALLFQQTLPRDVLREPQPALATARDLLSRQAAGANISLNSSKGNVHSRSDISGSCRGPAAPVVEPELRDQIFIISRWLRRNAGEGRHFFLPADEDPSFLALRLGAWLREVAAECDGVTAGDGDPASHEAELLAEWSD
jgi:excinuclease UvrABC nuclease subunit